ncbi:hypothetical protein P5V15_011408 [Pogonomyrmex californicus]
MSTNSINLKASELKQKLMALGLPITGKKAEMIDRLNTAGEPARSSEMEEEQEGTAGVVRRATNVLSMEELSREVELREEKEP